MKWAVIRDRDRSKSSILITPFVTKRVYDNEITAEKLFFLPCFNLKQLIFIIVSCITRVYVSIYEIIRNF